MSEQLQPSSNNALFYRMGHMALRVRDLKRSIDFYTRVFGMEMRWQEPGEIAFLNCGNDDLALLQLPPDALERTPEQSPADRAPRLDHLGFRVRGEAEVDRAEQRIRQAGVPNCGAARRHRDGAYSFYVPDPDGHLIQVLFDPTLP